jgi:hypothetical protein
MIVANRLGDAAREQAVRTRCDIAFEHGTVGTVRTVLSATAVLLDSIAQAGRAVPAALSARDELTKLVAVQTALRPFTDDMPAAILLQDAATRAGVYGLLCDTTVGADRTATELLPTLEVAARIDTDNSVGVRAMFQDVDEAHRALWDTLDALAAADGEVTEQQEQDRIARRKPMISPTALMFGGVVVAAIGAAVWFAPNRRAWL